jgi:nucleotide-binding universal stress UspA family protein
MYKHILIPTDGSALADKAVEQGTALAKRIGAKIAVLTVSVPFHILTADPQMIEDTAPQYKKRMEAHAAKVLKAAPDTASAAGVACATSHVEHEHPYQAIIETAHCRYLFLRIRLAPAAAWATLALFLAPNAGCLRQYLGS